MDNRAIFTYFLLTSKYHNKDEDIYLMCINLTTVRLINCLLIPQTAQKKIVAEGHNHLLPTLQFSLNYSKDSLFLLFEELLLCIT